MNKLCGHWYRDKDGKRITIEQLEVLLQDDNYRVVVQDKIGPYFFSTVWMGVPHGCRDPYDYFETIVFLTPEGANDPREELGKTLDCYRYHSYEEALVGHYQVVDEWKNRLPTKEELE